jgi:hypothetical protein
VGERKLLLELIFSWRSGRGSGDRELCGYPKVLWLGGIGWSMMRSDENEEVTLASLTDLQSDSV